VTATATEASPLYKERPLVEIGEDAIPRLLAFCEAGGHRRLLLVADENTHRALGAWVARSLEERGFDLRTVVLAGSEVLADGDRVLRVLFECDTSDRTFLSVGAGTVTDIARIVSHRTGRPFIAVPTAPSVDGYTSTNVPLIVGGIKRSTLAHAPLAVFADMRTLRESPRRMIASGFGDMLGKYTSVADWRIGNLLWDQPYDEAIARRALAAASRCADLRGEIAGATGRGVRGLMEALIESGFCMTDFGNSLPASGTEHYFSHCWEMKLLREGRPQLLHGAKVGVAAVLVAGMYERLRKLSQARAAEMIGKFRPPSREEVARAIRSAWGPVADELIAVQAPFLDLGPKDYERLKRRIIDGWPRIQDIAGQVPVARRLAEMLREVGGPTVGEDLGLTDEDIGLAASSAHHLRSTFTVRRLMELLQQSRSHLGDGET
jgi:glycerol-1-phosphate dehydrogenase [NAD(P)+]